LHEAKPSVTSTIIPWLHKKKCVWLFTNHIVTTIPLFSNVLSLLFALSNIDAPLGTYDFRNPIRKCNFLSVYPDKNVGSKNIDWTIHGIVTFTVAIQSHCYICDWACRACGHTNFDNFFKLTSTIKFYSLMLRPWFFSLLVHNLSGIVLQITECKYCSLVLRYDFISDICTLYPHALFLQARSHLLQQYFIGYKSRNFHVAPKRLQ